MTRRFDPYVVKGMLGAGALMATMVAFVEPADANFCSVFHHRPCAPTYCSPFAHRPCRPFYGFPLGENLQLTIESNSDAASANPEQKDADRHDDDTASAHDVDTIRAMFAALRACWQPPPEAQARGGMQMSVRLSFTRDGNLKGPPRVTYVLPGVTPEERQVYEQAIKETLDRCTPMQFSRGMGGAIAGRPIAVRFVDNRKPIEDQP